MGYNSSSDIFRIGVLYSRKWAINSYRHCQGFYARFYKSHLLIESDQKCLHIMQHCAFNIKESRYYYYGIQSF